MVKYVYLFYFFVVKHNTLFYPAVEFITYYHSLLWRSLQIIISGFGDIYILSYPVVEIFTYYHTLLWKSLHISIPCCGDLYILFYPVAKHSVESSCP